jgi:signal peptidase II
MKSNKFLRAIVILLLLTLNIGCDQVSKSIVRHNMNFYSHVGFLHDHITISKVENTGAFLSLGDSLSGPLRMILLNIIPFMAIAFGLYFIFTKNLNRIVLFGLILIIGGGAGNLYDRIAHGSVTDFLYINFVIFQTGVFNVADMSIMAGMLIILIYSFLKKKDEAEVSNVSDGN